MNTSPCVLVEQIGLISGINKNPRNIMTKGPVLPPVPGHVGALHASSITISIPESGKEGVLVSRGSGNDSLRGATTRGWIKEIIIFFWE